MSARSRARDKILAPAALALRADHERRRGRTLALANGIFDLLHVGHLRYLEAASTEADVLVVAVNADATASILKGPGRPVLPEQERAELVGALRCVDVVVIFHERDVRGLLERLRPDVHCKGTDYTPTTVPEGDLARSLGIRVAICGDPKRHATTELLRRLGGQRAPEV